MKHDLWLVMAMLVAVGCVGKEGPAGPQGPAGYTGATGVAGAEGPSGPRGIRGPTGATGVAGAVPGPSGPAGEQGERGWTGAQGATGPTGARGATGSTGAQGAAGVTGRWVSYREFWFESGKDGIRPFDTNKVSEIADYMEQNPLIQIGIDSFNVQPNQDLRDRRIRTVSDALIQAGVPVERLWTGALGDPTHRLAERVELLVVNRQK